MAVPDAVCGVRVIGSDSRLRCWLWGKEAGGFMAVPDAGCGGGGEAGFSWQ